MTLSEMKQSDAVYVRIVDVAGVMNVDPQRLRCRLRADPTMLGFPIVQSGNRIKIPRKPYLASIGEGEG